VEYEPLGVALVLSAWNYPIYTAVPQVAAAISAGNCVILKPSELAPYTSKILKKLFDKYMDPSKSAYIKDSIESLKGRLR
jgi:aldehyde dehydrogenase (NAD+)